MNPPAGSPTWTAFISVIPRVKMAQDVVNNEHVTGLIGIPEGLHEFGVHVYFIVLKDHIHLSLEFLISSLSCMQPLHSQ